MLTRRAVLVSLLAYIAFVVYGSLVPLELQALTFDEAWLRFRDMPYLQLGVESRADWIANGVLYAPVGFLASWWLMRHAWPRTLAVGAALTLGAVLAIGVEFAQVYFPPRTVSLNDVIAECLGTLLGSFAAALSFHRLRRSSAAVRTLRDRIRSHGLQLYAIAYVAFSLFPYDLLLSRVELGQKLDSELWGWWLAGQGGRPALVVVLQLLVEAALTIPLGLLFARRPGDRPAATYPGAGLFGFALGLGIEGAQLLIASGTSQGLSVLTRIGGAVAGLALWRHRDDWNLARIRDGVRRHARWLFPAYAVALIAVNGWFTYGWQGRATVVERWHDIHFLPLYYHYYTTEAQALFSLANVVLMYLPVAFLMWAWRRSARAAAGLAAGLAAIVEASKLSLAGLHPDPSNVWIAAFACWAFVRSVDAAALWRTALPTAAPRAVPAGDAAAGASATGGDAQAPADGSLLSRGSARAAALVGTAALLALHLASAAAFGPFSAALIAACALCVWVRPVSALLIVPALLPALDLAPWTGRFFRDEFDALIAVCLWVGYLRSPRTSPTRLAAAWSVAFAGLALAFFISTVIGAMPWPVPDADSFARYDSPYNALRIAKGVVWAGLFVALARRFDASERSSRRVVGLGLVFGLAYVVAFMAWERVTFAGLFDLVSTYRATGPFSAMHRGGAFVECFIALALPFALNATLGAKTRLGRVAGAALLVAAGYAMVVTFSRNGYAALVVAVVVSVVLTARLETRRRLRRAGVSAALGLGLVLLVLMSPYARERLAHWHDDLTVRQAHWVDALSLRDRDLRTAVFGMGVGRFPFTHYWRSREPVRAGSYRLGVDGPVHFLRLGSGTGPLYIEQFVHPASRRPHALKMRIRANTADAAVETSVCEKWMLTSNRCVAVSLQAGRTAGSWTSIESTLDFAALGEGNGVPARPLKFSLRTPSGSAVVDLTDIVLQDADGHELLANGSFGNGLDRWFFTTDADPPWHIHSLPVAVLFDQGWFGVGSWGLLLVTAVVIGVRRAWRGDPDAAAAVASLAAFLVSASLNTLIDDPRFLSLLLVLTGLCCFKRKLQPARSAAQADPPRSGLSPHGT